MTPLMPVPFFLSPLLARNIISTRYVGRIALWDVVWTEQGHGMIELEGLAWNIKETLKNI